MQAKVKFLFLTFPINNCQACVVCLVPWTVLYQLLISKSERVGVREVVKKKNGIFTVRLTVRGRGGGVSPLGPDRKQM